MLIFRLGGDLFQIEPSGAVRLHPTGMEGGYIVAVEPNRYLITGAPFSLWFNSANGSFERVEVRGAVRPALHAESVYLFDSTDQHVTILNKGQITTLPVKDDAWISGLAVTADGTLFLAERTGSDKDRGRVLRHAEGTWVPLRAPFAGPVIDLSADDAQLLAITPQGVFRYDLPSDTWTREEITDPGWLFVRQSQQLCIFNTLTGAVLARRDGTWRPERFVVPLGAEPVGAVKGS
jgi:hypothetical protein